MRTIFILIIVFLISCTNSTRTNNKSEESTDNIIDSLKSDFYSNYLPRFKNIDSINLLTFKTHYPCNECRQNENRIDTLLVKKFNPNINHDKINHLYFAYKSILNNHYVLINAIWSDTTDYILNFYSKEGKFLSSFPFLGLIFDGPYICKNTFQSSIKSIHNNLLIIERDERIITDDSLTTKSINSLDGKQIKTEFSISLDDGIQTLLNSDTIKCKLMFARDSGSFETIEIMGKPK